MEAFGFQINPLPLLLGGAAILMRLIGLLLALPFWRSNLLPGPIRVLLAVYLTVLFVFALGIPTVAVPGDVLGYVDVLLPELLLGVGLGMSVRITLAAAEGAGRLVSQAVGLGFATSIDPESSNESDSLGRLLGLMASLLLISLDVHLALLRALLVTFRDLAPGTVTLSQVLSSGEALAGVGGQYFSMAAGLAAPVMAAGMGVAVLLAVLGRVAPQMNLFAVGFLITIPAGLLVLAAALPETSERLVDILSSLPEGVTHFLSGSTSP